MYNTNYMNTKVAGGPRTPQEVLSEFDRSIPGKFLNQPGRAAQLAGSGLGLIHGMQAFQEGLTGGKVGIPRLGLAALGAGASTLGLLGGADSVLGDDYFLGRVGRRIANSSDKERRVAQGLLGGAGLLGGGAKAVQHLMGGNSRKAALYGLLGLTGAGTFLNSFTADKAISDPSRFSDFTGMSSGVRGIGGPITPQSLMSARVGRVFGGPGSDLVSKEPAYMTMFEDAERAASKMDKGPKDTLLDELMLGKELGEKASPFMDKLLESVPFTSQRARAAKEEEEAKLRMGKELGEKASPFMDKLLESVPFTSQRARAAKEEREKAESLYEMFSDPESKSEPTNFADYIMNNPGKSALGAGLGSALVYNALGGREGIQEKLEAMRRNPGATAAGLGSLGVLSAATYDAMREKKSNDTNPRTAGPAALFGDLYLGNTKNEDGKSDIEVKSQNEGNILAKADKGADIAIEYLPYLLAAGALGGAGYGGYKLVDFLKDKKEDRKKKANYELVSKERKSYLDEIADHVPKSMIGAGVTGGFAMGLLPEMLGGGSVLRGLAKSIKPGLYSAGIVGTPMGVYSGIRSAYKHNSELDALEQLGLIKKSAHGGSPEHKYTKEYDHNSLLQGKQKTDLPDFLQKEIIDSRSKSANFLRSLYS